MADEEAGYPKKRARTRASLRAAGMKVIARSGPDGVTVGEVVKLAGVAQGTLYNHFPSVSDLIDEIAEHLGTGVEIARDALDAVESDPAGRVAIGLLQFLDLAHRDPDAGAAFVALTRAKPDFRARVRAIISSTIAEGAAAGRFDVGGGPEPTNMVLGAGLQSIRAVVLKEADISSGPAVCRLVLRGLGVPESEITGVVDRAVSALALVEVEPA